MQSFLQMRLEAKLFREVLLEHTIDNEDGTFTHPTLEKVSEIHQEMFPDFPVNIADSFIVQGPFVDVEFASWSYNIEAAEKAKEFFSNPMNRLRSIYWWAIVKSFGSWDNRFGVGYNKNVVYARGGSSDRDTEESNVRYVLRFIAGVVPSQEYVKLGREEAKREMENIEQGVKSRSGSNADTGLAKILNSGPTGNWEWKRDMEQQIGELIKQLPSNGLAARTWGFEIESPDCKGVVPIPGSGIDKGDDGSLRSYESNDDCECGCRDCCYHSCDCDNCDMYNEDPDHCGSDECSTAESAEYRSTGGIQRVKHNGMYKLCEDLQNEGAEINDSAGTHIHVWGQDLTTHQVGQVMATYKRLEGLFAVLSGREDNQYARKISVEHVRHAIKEKNPQLHGDKPRAVNVQQLLGGRGTIEFRQMDCNYDADRITLFAWMVRGLVETAKRGAKLQSFMKVQNFHDLVMAFSKFNYFIQNEGTGLVVPGTKVDMNVVPKVSHNH